MVPLPTAPVENARLLINFRCLGLTESSIIASFTSAHDIYHGSSGSLLPLVEARLVDPEGKDIEAYDQPGELLLMSPSLVLGYLGDDEATKSTFDANGWLRTGDIGVMRVSPKQTEHLFILDRIKDMIKVKVCITISHWEHILDPSLNLLIKS